MQKSSNSGERGLWERKDASFGLKGACAEGQLSLNSFKIGNLTLTGPGVWHCWKRGAETRGRDRCKLPTWPSARTCLLSLLFIDCQNVTARGDLRNIPIHPSVGWVRKKRPALWRVPSLARGHMVGWRVVGRRATASASMPPVPTQPRQQTYVSQLI